MPRLTPLDPEALMPAQRALVEAIERGPRAARHGRIGLVGPFGVWLHAPTIGDAAQRFGAAVRFETTLPDNVKEVAICTVGSHYRAKFEFAAHGPLAIAAGVDPAIVEALRRGDTPAFTHDAERAAHEFALQLLTRHRLSDDEYASARSVFTEPELVELVSVIGYYCLISLTLNAFEVPLTAAMSDPFPD
jgi:4-carboxymuconolactone decarboxylase